jgi:hypothetical protein
MRLLDEVRQVMSAYDAGKLTGTVTPAVDRSLSRPTIAGDRTARQVRFPACVWKSPPRTPAGRCRWTTISPGWHSPRGPSATRRATLPKIRCPLRGPPTSLAFAPRFSMVLDP